MKNRCDVGIVGGGIAGLASAILLAKRGLKVFLWEQRDYPRHKVCGEYISMESYDFLNSIGIDLDRKNLPRINRLILSGSKGRWIENNLDVGGFGWSRYAFDCALYEQALARGVKVFVNEKVTNVYEKRVSTVHGSYHCDQVVFSYGKMTPSFVKNKKPKGKNYVGVKYHIQGDFDAHTIELHGFPGGYCGMSKVEEEKYCLCYLVDAEKLKNHKNSIAEVEKNVLTQNEKLIHLLKAERLFNKPLVISNIKFSGRASVYDGSIQLGDAAGAISPLSGNGMSMALRSAHIFNQVFTDTSPEHWNNTLAKYNRLWKKSVGAKIQWAEQLNNLVIDPQTFHLVLGAMRGIPWLNKQLVGSLQGKPIM
jgi:flavin-dependent dehydrogenase